MPLASLRMRVPILTTVFLLGAALLLPGDADATVLDGDSLDEDLVVPSSGTSPAQPRLTIYNGLEVQSGVSLTILGRNAMADVFGSQTFFGEGQITFEDPSTSFRSGTLRFSENTTLTLAEDFSVRATTMAGAIGAERGSGNSRQNIGLINYGLLSGEADEQQPLNVMNVDTANGVSFQNYGVVQAIGEGTVIVGSDWTNNGTFKLRDNGQLFLAGDFTPDDIGVIDRQGGELYIAGRVHNEGATISATAQTGSIVVSRGPHFVPGTTQIIGGVIDASDGEGWTIEGGELVDVQLSANVAVGRYNYLDVSGDLTLDDATISMTSDESTVGGARIEFLDKTTPQTLQGRGTIRFAEGRVNRIFIWNQLNVAAGVTIEGLGRASEIQGHRLENDGVISVEQGGQLAIQVEEFVNRGIISAAGNLTIGRDNSSEWRNEGTLAISAGAIVDLKGTFSLSDLGEVSDNGGEVRHSGVTDLAGGTLDLAALPFANPLRMFGGKLRNGRLESSSNATIDFVPTQYAAYLDNITLATDLYIPGGAGGATVRIENGLQLEDATITMPEGAGLVFHGEIQELRGTGTVLARNQRQTSAITTIAGDSLVIGQGITIRNGDNPWRELRLSFQENQGVIIAEAPDTLVSVSQSAGRLWTNNGTIVAKAGTVEFSGNYSVEDLGDLQNPSGHVLLNGYVDNTGRTLLMPPSQGRWTIDAKVAGGVLEAGEGMRVELGGLFDNVTIRGEFESHRGSRGSGSFSVRDQLTLDDATLVINSGDVLHSDRREPLLIDGEGTIQLNGVPGSSIVGYTTALTIAPGISIRTGPEGGGTIEADTVVNLGSIMATHAGQSLAIEGSTTNQGLLWAASGTLRAAGPVVNDGGAMVLSGGAMESESIQSVNDGQFIFLAGRLTVGMFDGDLTTPADGVLAPGPLGSLVGAGTTTVLGDLTQLYGAELSIEVGDPDSANASDFVGVSGQATLNGELTLSLASHYRPVVGDVYVVLDSSTLVGEFRNAPSGSRLITADGKSSFVVNYGAASEFDPTQVVLSDYQPTLPGDYNDDGFVDAEDYTVWRDNLGSAAGALANDADGGEIGAAQYNTWVANYGMSASQPDAPFSVPESGAMILAACGLISLGMFQRRSRLHCAQLAPPVR